MCERECEREIAVCHWNTSQSVPSLKVFVSVYLTSEIALTGQLLDKLLY